MGDLTEVIDAGAFANNGVSKHPAIYAGICPDRHMVLQNDPSEMGRVLKPLGTSRDSKSALANSGAGEQGQKQDSQGRGHRVSCSPGVGIDVGAPNLG